MWDDQQMIGTAVPGNQRALVVSHLDRTSSEICALFIAVCLCGVVIRSPTNLIFWAQTFIRWGLMWYTIKEALSQF